MSRMPTPNSIAVFDVGTRGSGRPLGFIPTGWFPSSVRLTPDGRTLLVLCARGLEARPSALVGGAWRKITGLYAGSLGVVPLPRGDAFARAMAQWTGIAQRCRPAAPAAAVRRRARSRAHPGDPTPIRYVVYVIKENRTYDQVLGDLVQGNGDPALCLFPERVTPNIHALARQFVLLDNFYANAEVSASGHEWSMAGYSAEFVERSWPVELRPSQQHARSLPERGGLCGCGARPRIPLGPCGRCGRLVPQLRRIHA